MRVKSKFLALILAPLIMGAAPCTTQLAELLSDSDSSQVSDQDLVEAYKELFSSLPKKDIGSLLDALKEKVSFSEVLIGSVQKGNLLKSFNEASARIREIRSESEYRKILAKALRALLKTKTVQVQKRKKTKKKRTKVNKLRKLIFTQKGDDEIKSLTWSDDGKWIAFAGQKDHVTIISADDESMQAKKIKLLLNDPEDKMESLRFMPNSLDLSGISKDGEIYHFKYEAPGVWTSERLGEINTDGFATMRASPVAHRYTLTIYNSYAGLFEADKPDPVNALNSKVNRKWTWYDSSIGDSTFLANGEWRFVLVSPDGDENYLDIQIYGEGRLKPRLIEAYRITDWPSIGKDSLMDYDGLRFFADQRKIYIDFRNDSRVFTLNLGKPPKGRGRVSVNANQLQVINDRDYKTSILQIDKVALSPDGNVMALPGVGGKFTLIDRKTDNMVARRSVPETEFDHSPDLEYSPDGKFLAAASFHDLYIFDLGALDEENKQ